MTNEGITVIDTKNTNTPLIIKIMNALGRRWKMMDVWKFVFNNRCKYTETELKSFFGSNAYEQFREFAMGAHPVCLTHVVQNNERATIKLNGEGLRKYHQLLREEREIKNSQSMLIASVAIAAGSVVTALFTIVQLQLIPIEISERLPGGIEGNLPGLYLIISPYTNFIFIFVGITGMLTALALINAYIDLLDYAN